MVDDTSKLQSCFFTLHLQFIFSSRLTLSFDRVNFFFNSTDNDFRSMQMDSILKWLCRFQVHSQRPNDLTEIVAFDILCGTFNFDNMSPGE